MLKTYRGGCHCAAIKFEAALDLSQSSYRCNCSICRRTHFWPAVAEPDGSDEELSRVPITYVDGRNDRLAPPEHFSYL